MSEEAKTTEAAAEKPASQTTERQPITVAESVKAAISQVKGEGAATESTATQETDEKKAPEGDEKAAETQESKGETKTEEKPTVLSGDDLKKYMKETPIWDYDLEKLPEELRAGAQTLKRRATKDFQSLADQRKSQGNPDRQTKKTETTETVQRDGEEKPLTDDELYELMMSSPEGMRKAMKIFNAQNVPEVVQKAIRDQQTSQSEQQETRQQQVIDAIGNLSAPEDGEARVPELANKDFQELVAKVIEGDKRIGDRIVNAKSLEEIEDAIETASWRAKDQQSKAAPAKPKVNAGKTQDQLDREKKNAGEKGSIAARKGSKVGTGTEGPMTVAKSVQLAKQRVAAGESPV